MNRLKLKLEGDFTSEMKANSSHRERGLCFKYRELWKKPPLRFRLLGGKFGTPTWGH